MEKTKTKTKHTWRFWVGIFAVVWAVSVVAGGVAMWKSYSFMNTAPATPGEECVIDIVPGSSFDTVAEKLFEQGVITGVFPFKVLALLQEKGNKLQAGRFMVNTGWLPQQVLDQLVSGKPLLYRVTLREGLPWWEVGRILEQEGFCTAADFEKVIHDPEFLRHWGIPFSSAEGFLYPDTYLLPMPRELNEQAAKAVAGRLVDTFWRNAGTLWESKPDTATLRRLLSLASIVERETGVPEERPRVAGVYTNRLQRNMLLQADPTIIYGLGPSFSGPLLKKHLEDTKNTYNTYQIAGLPPGPICSPSLASLKAALHPEDHAYLYFVAKGTDASHTFSTNLQDHNRAVQAYRKAVRGN